MQPVVAAPSQRAGQRRDARQHRACRLVAAGPGRAGRRGRSDPRYVIGISYPPQINQYPGLAKAVGDYAGAARQGLMEAVKDLGQEKPTAPYELSLAFDMVANTPEVVAVSGNGSRYTGGAHGEPLVARFTWLPQRQTLLTTQSLLTQGKGLEAVSSYVREQLHTAASLRNDDPGMSPEDRASLLQSATQMIDEGTAPKLENFSLFQPVMNADGKITALRFASAVSGRAVLGRHPDRGRARAGARALSGAGRRGAVRQVRGGRAPRCGSPAPLWIRRPPCAACRRAPAVRPWRAPGCPAAAAAGCCRRG